MADDAQLPTGNPWLRDSSKYQRRPGFPYRQSSRRLHDQIYEAGVKKQYTIFHSQSWMSDDDKAKIEDRVRTAVLLIESYDTWREFHNQNYHKGRGIIVPVFLLPAVVIAWGIPFAMNENSSLPDSITSIVGLSLGFVFLAICVLLIEWLSTIFPTLSRGLPDLLVLILICAFVAAAIFQLRFRGQEALLSGLAGALWVLAMSALGTLFLNIANALNRRKKALLHVEDDTIHATLVCLSYLPPNDDQRWDSTTRKNLSSQLLYIADTIESAWSRLAPPDISGTTRLAIHRRFIEIATSIRRLAFDVVLAGSKTVEELKRRLSDQLRAVASGKWGDLEVEEPPSVPSLKFVYGLP